MMLPQGVAKSTGLRQALQALPLSIHNAVGIGDADNDHTFTVRTGQVACLTTWLAFDPTNIRSRIPRCRTPMTIKSLASPLATSTIERGGAPHVTREVGEQNVRDATGNSRSKRRLALSSHRERWPIIATASSGVGAGSTWRSVRRASPSWASASANRSACRDGSEKSTGQNTRLNGGCAARITVGGTVSTGQVAVRNTLSVTDPSISHPRPVRPWVPMISRSAPSDVAHASIRPWTS